MQELFRTTTFSENQLLHVEHLFRGLILQSNQFDTTIYFPNSYFFKAVLFSTAAFSNLFTSSQEVFFQNSNYFRVKLIPSSYLLGIDSSLGQPLFQRMIFRIKIEELLFRSRYFYTVVATFSTNKANSPKEIHFKKSYFFRKSTTSNQLLFQKSKIPQLRYSDTTTLSFHNYNSFLCNHYCSNFTSQIWFI